MRQEGDLALTALLFAHHGAGADGEPPTVRRVAGLAVLDRQIRQARRHGAGRILVAVERMPPRLARILAEADVEVVRAPDGIAFAADERVLVIEDSLLADDRIVGAALAKEAVAVWKGRAVPAGARRIDPSTHWAGVAVYRGSMIVGVLAALGDWDLQETLLRAAFADGRPPRVDVATLDTYAPAEGRNVTILWAQVRDEPAARQAAAALLDAGPRRGLAWPSRFLAGPVEDFALRRLLARPVGPELLVGVARLLAVLATIGFAAGWLWPALGAALLVGPVEGTARRLASVRQAPARESMLDRLLEYGWYLALAGHFALDRAPAGPWAIAALIVLASAAATAHRALYRRFAGRPLDDAGPLERRLAPLAGQRSTYLWSLLAFAVLGAWYAGFAWLALYAVATGVATVARSFVRLAEYGRANSPRIAANLDLAGDDFLSRRNRSAN